ncbi:hypothetical protein QVD17_13216 [Tagetes erecta]|uniref:Late embryogenesis abundant protein LEA-2 subgroup domain-containing protein n=1 Tax=Tagetes erecta TaxID=13708 RepID=A0AAD8KVN3_TARER|nr:hypothetical protein QVD17_13216 [Tagetes erecta]
MTTMTAEEDSGPDNNKPRRMKPVELLWATCYVFTFVIIIVTLIVLLNNPVPSLIFTLQDVKLYAFNVSTTKSTVTTNLQVTIFCENNNNNNVTIGFHLDKVDVYASYMSQRITQPTRVPATYIGKSDDRVWSLSLVGTEVPVSPDRAVCLAQDEIAEMMLINVEVTAKIRTRYIHLRYQNRLKVYCRAYVMFGNNNDDTNVVGWDVKGSFVDKWCDVEIDN